jgi:hypothetical protein
MEPWSISDFHVPFVDLNYKDCSSISWWLLGWVKTSTKYGFIWFIIFLPLRPMGTIICIYIYAYTIIYNHIQSYTIIYNHIQSYTIIYIYIYIYTYIYTHIMCVEMREDVNFNPSEMCSEDLQWSWKSRYRAWRWWCWHTASTLKGQGCHIQSHSETFVGQDAIHIEAKSATHTEAEEKIWAIYDKIRKGNYTIAKDFLIRHTRSKATKVASLKSIVRLQFCVLYAQASWKIKRINPTKASCFIPPISIHMNHI